MAIAGGILSNEDGEISLTDNLKYVEKIRKELTKAYGAGICKSGKEIIENKKQVLKIGPALNAAMNGGFLEGGIITCSGKQKGGKTTTTLSFISECQKAGRHVYYHDIELRLKPLNLAGISGLKNDPENLTVIASERGKILRAEDHLSIIEQVANSHPGAVIIMDSASALCSEKESNSEMTAQFRADGPKLLSQFCRKISNVIAVNNVTLWIIQRLITNTSGYGAMYNEDGGLAVQYSLNDKLRLKSHKNWTVGSGDNEKTIGLILTWQIVTSGLGALPGTECTSYIRFGRGIDHTMEYIDLGLKLGFVEKAGAWFSYGDTKVQGEAKLYDYFDQNPDKILELRNKLCDIYGFDI